MKRVLFTYQDGRLDRLHDFEQRFHHFVILRVPDLVAFQITLGPILYEQSIDVHHPDIITRLLLSATISLHRFHAEISYSDSRLQPSRINIITTRFSPLERVIIYYCRDIRLLHRLENLPLRLPGRQIYYPPSSS